MKAIAQTEIIALISDINVFADKSENLISTTQATYDKEKITLQTRHRAALSALESGYQNNCSAVRNKSQQTVTDAKKILSEITKLDEQLSLVDKYYVKTKKKKEETLSQVTSSKYDEATDFLML